MGQTSSFRELLSNLHLWFQHLELILNVLLHARVGGGGQSHHGNRAELLAQHIQPFVVLPKIVTPLVQKQNSGLSEQGARRRLFPPWANEGRVSPGWRSGPRRSQSAPGAACRRGSPGLTRAGCWRRPGHTHTPASETERSTGSPCPPGAAQERQPRLHGHSCRLKNRQRTLL